jgi:hypothetical protein
MTCQGSAQARFTRFIRGGNVFQADLAARELGSLSLSEALSICLLYEAEGATRASSARFSAGAAALGVRRRFTMSKSHCSALWRAPTFSCVSGAPSAQRVGSGIAPLPASEAEADTRRPGRVPRAAG